MCLRNMHLSRVWVCLWKCPGNNTSVVPPMAPLLQPLNTEILPFLSTRDRGPYVLLAPNTCLFLQKQQASQAQALDRDPVHSLHTPWAVVKASSGADHPSSSGVMEGNLSSWYLGCLLPHCLFKGGQFMIRCCPQVF